MVLLLASLLPFASATEPEAAVLTPRVVYRPGVAVSFGTTPRLLLQIRKRLEGGWHHGSAVGLALYSGPCLDGPGRCETLGVLLGGVSTYRFSGPFIVSCGAYIDALGLIRELRLRRPTNDPSQGWLSGSFFGSGELKVSGGLSLFDRFSAEAGIWLRGNVLAYRAPGDRNYNLDVFQPGIQLTVGM
ncbi:MAG: hypothetical protein AAGA48_34685 [Myxococcota bacterium]